MARKPKAEAEEVIDLEAELEAVLEQEITVKSRVKTEDLLSTGSTLLNLACSGRTEGGFFKGGIFFFVGDSGSGKTWLTLTCLAEAANNGYFNDHRFVLNCPENGALMDFADYFGERMSSRVEPPSGNWDDPQHANTLEEFYDGILDRVKQGPIIEILDSMDAITPQADLDKYQEQRDARAKGKEATGTYGTSKARTNSAMLREVNNAIQKNGSILLLISQTKTNIGFGSQFNPYTYSGGLSLKFFSQLQMWTSSKGKIKRKANEKDRVAGLTALVKIKKNRLTGKDRQVEIPIYDSYGIDDLGSMFNFLIEEGGATKVPKGIIIPGINNDQPLKEDKLAGYIEDNDLIPTLQGIVATVWHNIEKELKLPRKKRYE